MRIQNQNQQMTRSRYSRSRAGFTLIEMIGVLAIISLLAAIVLPRVFEAVSDAQINSVAESVTGVKTGIIEYYTDHGTLPTYTAAHDIEKALIADGFLEKIFEVPIGDAADILRQTTAADGTAPTLTDGTDFDLDGDGTTDLPASASVISAQIQNVDSATTHELETLLDGDLDGDDDPSNGNNSGQVVWQGTTWTDADGNAGTGNDVYIYIAHR